MEPNPTGESAAPSVDGDDPAVTERAAGAADPPGTRKGTHALPRRPRAAGARAVAEVGPDEPVGRDPDGRAYGAPDEETLTRLLSGLREI